MRFKFLKRRVFVYRALRGCRCKPRLLRIHPDEPEAAHIDRVVQSLDSGNVVALPTDTFYGLAVDPVNLRAVDRIYELKMRARHKPLSLLISEVPMAYELAPTIDGAFDRLAERFLAGAADDYCEGRGEAAAAGDGEYGQRGFARS